MKITINELLIRRKLSKSVFNIIFQKMITNENEPNRAMGDQESLKIQTLMGKKKHHSKIVWFNLRLLSLSVLKEKRGCLGFTRSQLLSLSSLLTISITI